MCRWRIGQADREVGHHEGEGGMAVAAMVAVVAMRRRFVAQEIETVVVVVEMMVMAVCRRGVEMPVQCVFRRPDGLERHEPHQKDQERTTHGTMINDVRRPAYWAHRVCLSSKACPIGAVACRNPISAMRSVCKPCATLNGNSPAWPWPETTWLVSRQPTASTQPSR